MTMKTNLFAAAGAMALAATAAAAAQQPAQPAQTIQQQFDAAALALEGENWDEALRVLESLEARVARTGNARSLAVVRVRKAQALLRVDRHDEAVAAIRTSLPLLPETDASLVEDRFRSYVALGRVSELRLDYRDASAQYRTAAAMAVDAGLRTAVYRGLIQTLMFYDAPAALAAADQGLVRLAEAAPGNAALEGQLRTLRGRTLLNMGRFRDARAELERATRNLGGLGTRVDLRDLIARSDLAIAALLAGAPEDARRFLSLTGAGRTRHAAVPVGGRMVPPRCGDGLSPSDVAVVEIAIRDDGSVATASPVYASVQGDAAVRFARAALAWSWLPEQVSEGEPIFRMAARVEVRCTMGPLLPGTFPPEVEQEAARWSAATGIPIELVPARNRTVAVMRTDLAAAEARHGADSPHLLHLLHRLAARDDVPDRERLAFLRRALPIARAARVPSPLLALLAGSIAQAQVGGGNSDKVPDFLALLDDPALAGDPYVAAALHLAAADGLHSTGEHARAVTILARLAARPDFGADHPLRPNYFDLLAAAHMASGNATAAAQAWASIPAGSPRCQPSPHHRRGGADFSDFPAEAARWSFEGWAMIEAQIGRNGVPDPVRTTVAYPPFVFGQASERIVGRHRFAPAYAAETGNCATHIRRVRYHLPA
jgi:tetratricopeptide (TPR) repeat protein